MAGEEYAPRTKSIKEVRHSFVSPNMPVALHDQYTQCMTFRLVNIEDCENCVYNSGSQTLVHHLKRAINHDQHDIYLLTQKLYFQKYSISPPPSISPYCLLDHPDCHIPKITATLSASLCPTFLRSLSQVNLLDRLVCHL